MARQKMSDEQKAKKAAEKAAPKPSASLDEEIGKGLTPKSESKESSQAEKDFANHPKFSKFKGEG